MQKLKPINNKVMEIKQERASAYLLKPFSLFCGSYRPTTFRFNLFNISQLQIRLTKRVRPGVRISKKPGTFEV